MILCLRNARSGDLHFDTSSVALRALVREIIPNTIPTYIYTSSRSDFHRLLDSGFAPSALSLRLNDLIVLISTHICEGQNVGGKKHLACAVKMAAADPLDVDRVRVVADDEGGDDQLGDHGAQSLTHLIHVLCDALVAETGQVRSSSTQPTRIPTRTEYRKTRNNITRKGGIFQWRRKTAATFSVPLAAAMCIVNWDPDGHPQMTRLIKTT